ncbi:MAG TPA: TetR/AcrR family transcriptional regulator, partial [Patescibacteria group bacterium]|nr:TetR/AcrR family transcriptional regulator [Patescibacteria group bacterium]
ASRRAVLEAALHLIEEKGTAKGITMEAIAREAGVGKQTLYRWWSGTGEIFLEILHEHAEEKIDAVDGGNDLRTFLIRTFQALNPPVRLILKAAMAEAALDNRFRDRLVAGLIAQRRAVLEEVLQRTPKFSGGDHATLIDCIFGFMWYRLLLDVGPLESNNGEELAGLLLASWPPGRKEQ